MNQPAFPFVAEDDTGIMLNMGMDLRDYFAAKFIPEICKHSEFQGWNHLENAKICYQMADAMMEARKNAD